MCPVSPEGYRLQAEAAGGVDELARDPPGVVGGEKGDCVGDVGGFADAAEGVLRGDGGDEFGVATQPGHVHVGAGAGAGAGTGGGGGGDDGVDSDAAGSRCWARGGVRVSMAPFVVVWPMRSGRVTREVPELVVYLPASDGGAKPLVIPDLGARVRFSSSAPRRTPRGQRPRGLFVFQNFRYLVSDGRSSGSAAV